jgi:pentatricopeptide repeat protein
MESYSCLIGALCADVRPNTTRSLLQWMVEDGYSPNLNMHNMIVDSLCNCDNVKETLDIKVQMSSGQVKPDFDTYQALITSFCRLGRSLDGQSLMVEMI